MLAHQLLDAAAISGCRGPVANVRALAVSGRRGRLFRVGDRCRRCRRRRESPAAPLLTSSWVAGPSGQRPMLVVSWVTVTSMGCGSGGRGPPGVDAVERRGVVDCGRAGSCAGRTVESYLAWLANVGRSPNTVRAYAHDLKLFWTFLADRGLGWDAVTLEQLGGFVGWLRQPPGNVIVLSEAAWRRSPRSVNRALGGARLLRVSRAQWR